jgi:hypothetical protein
MFRKRLAKVSYWKNVGQVYAYQRVGLQQSAWMRSAVLLFAKPRLILVLAGELEAQG